MGINYVDPRLEYLANIETQILCEYFWFFVFYGEFQMNLNSYKKQKPATLVAGFLLRRIRDSNPWIPRRINGFQDHRIRPLCQLSGGKSNIFYKFQYLVTKKNRNIFLTPDLLMFTRVLLIIIHFFCYFNNSCNQKIHLEYVFKVNQVLIRFKKDQTKNLLIKKTHSKI